MPWTDTNYPDSLKNFMAPVRRKAIDIANALVSDGREEGSAIAIATSQAEEWAEKRGMQIRKKRVSSSGGRGRNDRDDSQGSADTSEKGRGRGRTKADPRSEKAGNKVGSSSNTSGRGNNRSGSVSNSGASGKSKSSKND